MLLQLRLCRRFDAVRLFDCRPSNSLGPIPSCGLPAWNHGRVLSDSPAADPDAAKDLRWLMLNLHGRRANNSFVPDARTVAECRTSKGRHLRVSFGPCAAPPASSFLYFDFRRRNPRVFDDMSVIAAHRDSLLLQLSHKRNPPATAAAAGSPSLSLIPVRHILTKFDSVYEHYIGRLPSCLTLKLDSRNTGLLRQGEKDLLMVQLHWYNLGVREQMVEVGVLCPGTDMWELKLVPILQDGDEVLRRWSGDDVIPVGDRYLCWVDYKNGFFLCDMADEASPKVRYVPVPPELISPSRSSDSLFHKAAMFPQKYMFPNMKNTRKMGATGATNVRFVSIDGSQDYSSDTTVIRTWTMDLSMDDKPLAWVKDGEMECEEIWALPGYECLPRENLLCPIVSLDDPNVVCFLANNFHFSKFNFHFSKFRDHKAWMIQLNMKTKTLLSVVQFTDEFLSSAIDHLPTEFQY